MNLGGAFDAEAPGCTGVQALKAPEPCTEAERAVPRGDRRGRDFEAYPKSDNPMEKLIMFVMLLTKKNRQTEELGIIRG